LSPLLLSLRSEESEAFLSMMAREGGMGKGINYFSSLICNFKTTYIIGL